MSLLERAIRLLSAVLAPSRNRPSGTSTSTRPTGSPTSTRPPSRPAGGDRAPSSGTQPGRTQPLREHVEGVREYTVPRSGLPRLSYAPQADGDGDPGEVVWAWVPYEEDNGQGKDRPVLLIAVVTEGFLGLQLTSKDHDRDRADEERWGRKWMDVGSGGWDRKGRPSEVRLDRVLLLPHGTIRREGDRLEATVFSAVAQAAITLHGGGR